MSTEEQLARALGGKPCGCTPKCRNWLVPGVVAPTEYGLPKLGWTSVPLVLAEIERRGGLWTWQRFDDEGRTGFYASVAFDDGHGDHEASEAVDTLFSAFLAAVASEGERQ